MHPRRPATGEVDQCRADPAGEVTPHVGFDLLAADLGLADPRQGAQHRPEVAPVLARLDDRAVDQEPRQLLLAVDRPDVGELALAVGGLEIEEVDQRHHVLVPGVGGCDPVVLAETRFGDREVGEGERHLHLLVAVAGAVLELVGRPVLVERGIAFEVEALRRRLAGGGVVAEDRIGARLDRQTSLVGAHVVADAVLRLARAVEVEQRRPPRLEAADEAFDHVAGVGDRSLHDVGGAVRHADQADLLARLLFALLHLAVLGHVGDLPDEARGAGLAAGVRVDLGVDHQHLDRLARGHEARQVLEADVVHGAVAAHRDHRRAELPLFVGELAPVEVGEELTLLRRIVAAGELELRLPDRPEAVGHLRHMALEDAHRHRRRVLEEVIRPRERVRVERVGGSPDRSAAGRVDHPHVRAAAAGDALAVAPLQILEARQQLRRAPQPLLVDRPAAALRLHAPGDAGERQVAVPGVADDLRHRRRVGEIEIGDQLHLDVPLEIRDELRELARRASPPAAASALRSSP